MFDLDKQALEAALDSIRKSQNRGIQRLRWLNKKIANLSGEVNKTEQRQEDLSRKEGLLRVALVVLNSWPTEIMKMREKLSGLREQATRDDITVGEQKRLCEEIVDLSNEIRKHCLHPFVIGYTGWEGSHSYDYDDGYRGKRLCLVCGFEECSGDKRKADYKILQGSDDRLIDGTRLDREKGYDVSQPFEDVVRSWISSHVYELQKGDQ